MPGEPSRSDPLPAGSSRPLSRHGSLANTPSLRLSLWLLIVSVVFGQVIARDPLIQTEAYPVETEGNTTEDKEISVIFPNFNIKIGTKEDDKDLKRSEGCDKGEDKAEGVRDGVGKDAEVEVFDDDAVKKQQMDESIWEEGPNIWGISPEPEVEPQFEPDIEWLPVAQYIEIEHPLQPPNYFNYPPQATDDPDSYYETDDPDNPILSSVRAHKHHENNYYYSSIPFAPDANTNILRMADPRIFSSHSHFLKVKKRPFSKTFIHSHHSVIGGPGHGSSHFGHGFGGFHGGGSTTIHKNTHVHVHGRDANEDAREARDTDDSDRIVGSHLFAAPRWSREAVTRRKRGAIEFVRLAVDPRTKIDMQKTSENVGAATRNVFEEDYSPLYHVRNAVGSVNDMAHSVMSMRPIKLFVPSKYKIVEVNGEPMVGAISPEIYSKTGEAPPAQEQAPPQEHGMEFNPPIDNFDDTMHRVGSILRESVQWAHKSAEHAADAMHSARQAVTTARKNWPKVLLPYMGALEVVKEPRGGKGEIVGSAQDPEFVGVGRIMDYFGMTGKEPEQPRLGSSRLGAPRRVTEEELLLNNAKDSLGTPTYRQFLDEMKKQLNKYQLRNALLETPKKDNENVGLRNPLLELHRLKAKAALERARAKARADALRLQVARLPAAPRLRPPTLPRLGLLRESPKIPSLPAGRTAASNIKLPNIQTGNLAVPPLNNLRETVNANLQKLRESLKAPKKPVIVSPILGQSRTITEKPEDTTKSERNAPKSGIDTENITPLDRLRSKLKNQIITSPNLEETENTPPNLQSSSKTQQNLAPPTPDDLIITPLEKLRASLLQKYKIPEGSKDDVLGRALSQLKSKVKSDPNSFKDVNPGENEVVGSPQQPIKLQPVPDPVFTREMKIPFMGAATKEELEEYFKKMYCPECKNTKRDASMDEPPNYY